MKAAKMLKNYVNRMRRKYAKRGSKNGVLPAHVFDFGSRGPWTDKKAKQPRYPEQF